MARHRKTKKRTHHRRRSRVGALDKNLLTIAAGSIGGYVVGNMIANNTSLFPTLDIKIKGAAVAAIGVLLVPRFMKSSIGTGLAVGMATAGGAAILKNMGVISGVGEMAYLPYTPQRRIAGAGISAQVNGPGISAQVNGGGGISATVNGKRRNVMQTAMRYQS